MNKKEYDRKPDEKFDDYAMRLYKIKDQYPKLTNDVIGFILNKESGNDWDESTYRKKFKQQMVGYNKGYKVGFDEGYKCCKQDIYEGDDIPDDVAGMESVTPKTHLDKMSELIGDYHVAKTGARKEQRILRKYMRRATPSVMLVEQYAKALQEDAIQVEEINDVYVEDINNVVIKVLLADWHTGMTVDEKYNVFNFNTAKKRLNKLKEEIILTAKQNNSNKISITHLGDICESYSMRSNQNFDLEFNLSEQIEHAQALLYGFVKDLANKGYQITLSGIKGNHDIFRTTKTKRHSLPNDNTMKVIMDNLKMVFNESDTNKITIEQGNVYDDYIETINGTTFKYVHGENEKTRDKDKVAKHNDMTRDDSIDVLCMGHMHHYRCITRNYNKTEIWSASLQGANDFSKTKIKSLANAGQTIIIVREDGDYRPFNVDLQTV